MRNYERGMRSAEGEEENESRNWPMENPKWREDF